MRSFSILFCALGAILLLTSCKTTHASATSTAPALTHKYRPDGDTVPKIDLSKIKSEELKKVYAHIDEHFDETSRGCKSGFASPASPIAGKAFRKRPRW